MTTIAFDGRYLAADGRVTTGSLITSKEEPKILRFFSKVLDREIFFSAAGSSPVIHKVAKWLQTADGACPEFTSDNFDGFVIGIDGQNGAELCPGGAWRPVGESWVGGSGYQIAMTCMHLGRTAMEAVKVATELDCYSGGAITYVDLENSHEILVLGAEG